MMLSTSLFLRVRAEIMFVSKVSHNLLAVGVVINPVVLEQVKGDGEPSCFSNITDTGIPDLQQWCHKLTISSRERAARTFMMHLKAFAQSVQSYVKGIGDVTTIDRESLREKWESRGFDEAEQYPANEDPLDAILGGLGAGIGVGLYSMNKPAPPKVDPYGQPTGVTPRLCTVCDDQYLAKGGVFIV
jgi:hypothetical protein